MKRYTLSSTVRASACIIAFAAIAVPAAAYAQGDPFANATLAADQAAQGLKMLALATGGVGMIACLMLGYFNKLNWRWVATGIGVSFALSIVPGTIRWLSGMA